MTLRRSTHRLWLCLLAALACPAALTQTPSAPAALVDLPRFSATPVGEPTQPWRIVGLPRNKAPLTRFEITRVDGVPVLSARTRASYGALTLDQPRVQLSAASTLSWRWRLEEPLRQADLARKEGDDTPIKLCLLFDMPLERLSWGDRTLMRLARSASGENLPSATLCYTWDHRTPAGTWVTNAYTGRVRSLVLDSGETRLGQWLSHERNVQRDFLAAFGTDTRELPPLVGFAIGADGDNTGGAGWALVGDVTLTP